MGAPLHHAFAALFAETEVVYGTVPTIVAADVLDASDITHDPAAGDAVSRTISKMYFTSPEEVLANQHQTISFSVPIAGTGNISNMAPVLKLINACFFDITESVGVSFTANPITDSPDSISLAYFVDANTTQDRWNIAGARGSFELVYEAGQMPVASFDFIGLEATVIIGAGITPDWTAAYMPQPVGCENTQSIAIHGTTVPAQRVSIRVDMQLQPVCVGSLATIFSSGREVTAEVKIIDTDATEKDWVAAVKARTSGAFSFTHGIGTAEQFVHTSANAELIAASGIEDHKGVRVRNLTLRLRDTAGNDELVIVQKTGT